MTLYLLGHSVKVPGEERMSKMNIGDGDDARVVKRIEHEASGFSSRSSWPPEIAVLLDDQGFRCIWTIDSSRDRHHRAVISEVSTRYTGAVPEGVVPVAVLNPPDWWDARFALYKAMVEEVRRRRLVRE